MPANAVPPLLQHVRRLAAAESSDEQLLADFLARRSDDAFAALLGRHGPMVLHVCRRILHDAHAAEDVFQATFLVLAGRAGAIRRRASVAGFLHGVAYRLAVRARRRATPGLPDAVCDPAEGPAEGLAWQEMLGILDHELGGLSDRYRAPLVLCYLEGRTQDEAARQLGWSLNTLRRRLARGRGLLEARLRGRGVTLPAALAGLLAGGAVAVPGPLRAATLAAAAREVGGAAAGASALPAARKGIPFLLSASSRKAGALVLAAALGAAAWFGYGLRPGEQTPPDTPATAAGAAPGEAADDPLPAGGAVRLGTARYRHGTAIQSLAVSADGGHAAVASPWHSFSAARVFDLTDGRCQYSFPYRGGSGIEAVGLSPDGKTLATKDGSYLSFRDAATGKELRKIHYVSRTGGGRSVTDWLTFTPDGKHLAATLMGHAVRLIDVGTGKVVRTFEPGAAASACVFSPDGRWMATAGYEKEEGGYLARLWEVGTGNELRRFPAGDFPAGNGRKRSLAFSPDGATLAGGGWGDGRVHLWEAATGKERKVLPKSGKGIQSVAFSPDGKTVAAAGDSIHLFDPATGKERLRIGRRARGLAYSRDGSVLTGAVGGALYRWDAAGRQLTPAAAQDTGVEQILAPADGRLFTLDQEGDLHAWDPAGKNPPRRVAGGVGRGAVASPDGRFLAWAVEGKYGGSRVRLYEVATGRFLDHFPVFTDDANVEGFLPDGKTLLTLDRGAVTARLWDVASGKERRSFPACPAKKPTPAQPVVHYPYANRRAALSPDGKTLAIGDLDSGLPVGLWDVATGKAGHQFAVRLTSVNAAAQQAHRVDLGGLAGRPRLNGYLSSGNGLAFSPDGRLLVTWSEDPFARRPTDHVAVWDVATGRAVTTLLADRPIGAGSAAFAPDGRTLATASIDGTVRLWEAATWKVRAEFRGHRDRITALAFGPDGRLFTGGLDTVVLGWDVRPPRDPAGGTLADAWEALAGADAKAGFAAQGRFLAEPAKAVEWFAARLTPAVRPEPARLKALIADLDAGDFAARERATAELREHGPFAAAALRAAVANPPSAEARRRAEGVLREVEGGVVPPGELRALRAVEVLEWLATEQARACLRGLAKGAPEARLTRAAAAARARLPGRE